MLRRLFGRKAAMSCKECKYYKPTTEYSPKSIIGYCKKLDWPYFRILFEEAKDCKFFEKA